MSSDLTRLKTLALAATQPGPWTVKAETNVKDGERPLYWVVDANGFWLAEFGPAPDDARYVAAVSPDVVLELIERLLTAEAYRLNRTTDQWTLDAKVKALTSALAESRESDRANAEASINLASELHHLREGVHGFALTLRKWAVAAGGHTPSAIIASRLLELIGVEKSGAVETVPCNLDGSDIEVQS